VPLQKTPKYYFTDIWILSNNFGVNLIIKKKNHKNLFKNDFLYDFDKKLDYFLVNNHISS